MNDCEDARMRAVPAENCRAKFAPTLLPPFGVPRICHPTPLLLHIHFSRRNPRAGVDAETR